MMKKIFCMCALGIILMITSAQAAVLNVPSQFPTISKAMQNAQAGDSIIVAPGTYKEIVTMKEGVRLIGSGPDVTKIIIPDGQSSPAVTGASNSTLDGFLIKRNESSAFYRAAILLDHVRHMIVSNIKVRGHMSIAISLDYSNYNTIQFVDAQSIDNLNQTSILDFGLNLFQSGYNHILSNNFQALSSGMLLDYSNNNKIEHNYSLAKPTMAGGKFTGAGIDLYTSNNNVLIHNTGINLTSGVIPGAGLHVSTSLNNVAVNNIFYGVNHGMHVEGSSTNINITVSYTDIKGDVKDIYTVGTPKIEYGSGILNLNPKVNTDTGALKTGSPCINAGDPTLPTDPDGSIADLGAFYFQP